LAATATAGAGQFIYLGAFLSLAMPISLDIIVLCKNNPDELRATLDSIGWDPPEALSLTVLIVDGSHDSSCWEVSLRHSLRNLIRFVSSSKHDVKGIYPSMNLALTLVRSDWCIFMNSGDEFHPLFDMSLFIDAANLFPNSVCIYGRSEIVSHSTYTWIMPSLRIRSIDKWCRYFEPSHQSMFVRSSVATAFPFSEVSAIGADSHWKRNIINSNPSIYLTECISKFYLGGASSSFGVQILLAKLQEPTRRPYEKLMEIIKYILFVFGLMSPRLQHLRSELIAFLF
jgi:hypothetical protein